MDTLYRLETPPRQGAKQRKAGAPTFFDRSELNQLLSLYSRRVATGEWRDYAIDHQPGRACFSMFRHTMDQPLYTVVKRMTQGGKNKEYLVFHQARTLKRASTLSEALRIFESRLKLVR